jgi:hypothetical protein
MATTKDVGAKIICIATATSSGGTGYVVMTSPVVQAGAALRVNVFAARTRRGHTAVISGNVVGNFRETLTACMTPRTPLTAARSCEALPLVSRNGLAQFNLRLPVKASAHPGDVWVSIVFTAADGRTARGAIKLTVV